MSEPNLPMELGPQKRSPQIDGRAEYKKGHGAIDEGGFSQSHKGYGHGGRNQPRGTHVPSAPARYTEDTGG